MSEFDEIYADEFFVIDCDNLDHVAEKFYGYMISENGIIRNENISSDEELTGLGAYLWVKVHEDTIRIIQDFNGSWELYIYRCEDNGYFAISNSYIKLLEHLKDNVQLTINRDYANSFLFIDLTSYFYRETLVNEIEIIPRNCEIIIDKRNRTFSYVQIDYEENSIELGSQESLKVLDEWFEKWVNIIRSIKSKTNNFSVDLTGGFDSRAVATIWLSANLNLDKLYVRTIENNTVKKLIRDLEVSSEISNRFAFPLNRNTISSSKKGLNDILTPILASFYLKLGFQKGLDFPVYRYDQPVYSMGGWGGGPMRGYGDKTYTEFINSRIFYLKDRGEEVCDSAERIFNSSFSKLLEDFPDMDCNSKDLPRLLYNEVRSRHHVGKVHVERYFRNVIILSPLLDPALRRFKLTNEECDDKNLLFALILTRFYPELLNIDFEADKKINEDTIDYANEINMKYPYPKKQYQFIEGPEIEKSDDDDIAINEESILNYLKRVFNSRFFELEFKKYYPSEFYDMLYNEINNSPVMEHANGAFAILNSINYASNNPLDMKSWLESFMKRPFIEDSSQTASPNMQYLKIYETARIDITKEGKAQNEIEILENSDKLSKIRFPKAFQKNGSCGFFITSDKGEINLKIRCSGEGKVKIFLKSLGLKDIKNTRFPIYIDYFSLRVNDEEYLNDNKLLCHDDRFHISLDVKDSEILDIYVKWLPYNELSIYKDKTKKLKNKIRKLQDENAKIENNNIELERNLKEVR